MSTPEEQSAAVIALIRRDQRLMYKLTVPPVLLIVTWFVAGAAFHLNHVLVIAVTIIGFFLTVLALGAYLGRRWKSELTIDG